MKKLIVVSIVILFVFMGGCTPNTGETPPESQSPDITLVFDHDLVGKTLEETIDILADIELEYEIVEEYSETLEQGCIVSQSIAPQSEIDETSKMVLTVSKGSEFVIVPDVIAMTGDEAIEVIGNKQLNHQFAEENSPSVSEGLVISQNPLPGTSMKIGSMVTFTVSLGPKTVQMVDLIGHTEAFVNSYFNDVNLTCEISYEQSNSVEAGKVISQSVAKDEYAIEGEKIYIVISEGLVDFVIEDYIGRPFGEVSSILNGRCVLETRFDYNPDYQDRYVIAQEVPAGTKITIEDRMVLIINDWDEKPVSFADPGLEQLIRAEINKSSGGLVYKDVKEILNLSNYGVTHDKINNLEGIENLTSLKSLYLFGENIVDVSPLAGLTELNSLNLECNNIDDVSSLSNLVKLENFALSSNQITDISLLSNMPNLKDVSVSGCPINSISVLSSYTNMSFLNISHTYVPAQEVREIVSGFTKLRALHMTGIAVGNLDFLTCFNTLTYISADYCELDNIDCLADFPYLKSARIYHNNIVDITPLQNLEYLETLFIGYNDISDIDTLGNLTKLEFLFISDIKATDFSVLSNLTRLKSLYISSNNIQNVEFLRPLVKLETLEICSDIQDLTNYYEIMEEHKDRGCDVNEKPQ
ncbi:MAG TPA: PASTA domain-containing protein [Clostridia bacterium]|nr:PASTA domain-containing protein [Clostridia bacterium]